MAYYNKRVIRHQSFGVSTVVGAGVPFFGMEPLTLLGIRGQIRRVCVRAELTTAAAGTLDTWIVDGQRSPIVSPASPPPPKDEDVFYANLGAVIVPSATTAMINDHVAATGGSDYEVDPVQAPLPAALSFAWQVTSGLGGQVDFLITVWSEVQL